MSAQILFTENASAPAAPSSGVAALYALTDNNLYLESPAGKPSILDTSYMYMTSGTVTLASSTANQGWLGSSGSPLTAGVSLQASTTYEFEGEFYLSTTGTVSHTEAIGFVYTTLTVSLMNCNIERIPVQLASGTAGTAFEQFTSTGTGSTVCTGAITTAQTAMYRVKGTITTSTTAGSLLPIIAFSAAPGGTSTTNTGNWFRIRPINTNIGTWS